MKKYYFSRRETAAIYADDEEEARLQLAALYESSEDFILDDVVDGVDVDGVFQPTKTETKVIDLMAALKESLARKG